MKQNTELSLRTSEATSLDRALSFNRPVVAKFVSNLKTFYGKYQLTPSQFHNVDDTTLTTVQDTVKVIDKKGQNQVGHIIFNERVTLVTK